MNVSHYMTWCMCIYWYTPHGLVYVHLLVHTTWPGVCASTGTHHMAWCMCIYWYTPHGLVYVHLLVHTTWPGVCASTGTHHMAWCMCIYWYTPHGLVYVHLLVHTTWPGVCASTGTHHMAWCMCIYWYTPHGLVYVHLLVHTTWPGVCTDSPSGSMIVTRGLGGRISTLVAVSASSTPLKVKYSFPSRKVSSIIATVTLVDSVSPVPNEAIVVDKPERKSSFSV